MVGEPGTLAAEGLQVTGVSAAANRISVRYDANFPGTQQMHSPMRSHRRRRGLLQLLRRHLLLSTPVVAGISALILTARPTLSWVEVREILRTTSRKINIGESNPSGLWRDLPPPTMPATTVLNDLQNGVRPKSPNVSSTLAAAVAAPMNPLWHLNLGQSTLRLTSAAGFEIGDAIHITDGVNVRFPRDRRQIGRHHHHRRAAPWASAPCRRRS